MLVRHAPVTAAAIVQARMTSTAAAAGIPATNARAALTCSGTAAIVTLCLTFRLGHQGTRLPGPAPPGRAPGTAAGTRGCTPDSAPHVKPRAGPLTGQFRLRSRVRLRTAAELPGGASAMTWCDSSPWWGAAAEPS